MPYTIDIDTGGTFTDGFFTADGIVKYTKVPTTPHDLTDCFMKIIEEGASLFGVRKEDMLSRTEVIRYSTTVGTNAIIQQTGPKLGVLVTRGYEDNLYGPPGSGFGQFVARDMVMGVEEEVGRDGVVKALDTTEARQAIEALIDRGARAIVVSLKNASLNPVHERAIRDAFEQEYPPHYLGMVPLILSTDLSQRGDDFKRTATAVINAYLHREMVKYLYRSDEQLRRAWYDRPLLITHSSGGTARVAKTTALNTYNSGPAAGMLGSALIANLYGLPNLISTDMGGTSLDIGFIVDGTYSYQLEPQIEGMPVYVPMIEVSTIGAGGGSIAWVDARTKEVKVGPQSAGAQPGPAAFDLGGMEPTVTDADIALGYIDPDNFLGGRMKLNRDKAAQAIRDRIAAPLSLSLEEAALRIKQRVDANVGARLAAEIVARGRSAKDFALLAYGGAGPTHCCGYAEALGLTRIITFPYSAVFSAFGSSTADVVHYYSRTQPTPVFAESQGILTAGIGKINGIVDELVARAVGDMRGEGFAADQLVFQLDLIMVADNNVVRLIHSPNLHFRGEQDLGTVCDVFRREAGGAREIIVDTFMLKASGAVPHWKMQEFELADENPSGALKGERGVYWEDGFHNTRVYEYSALRSGNVVQGPAIVESDSTTYVLPSGTKLTVDRYRNGIIEILR